MLDALWQDLRYGARRLRKSPGFTLIVLSVLALGIGANTAMFSVVNAFLMRPLPVREVDRLVVLFALQGPDPFGVSVYDYQEWSQGTESFESVAIGQVSSMNLTGAVEPERVNAAAVIPDYFRTLGVEPAQGRNFLPEESQGARPALSVILSHGLWQRRFGGAADILNQTVLLDGQGYTVVGVMPPGFDLPFGSDLWIPFSLDAVPENLRGFKRQFGVARLKPGVSRQQAQGELEVIAERLAQRYPDTHQGWSAGLLSYRRSLMDDFNGNVHTGLLTLLAAVGFLLLIACANLANLVFSRALGRSHEIAVRQALGASSGRLVRQLLTEGFLLLVLGGTAGVLLAMWATPYLVRLSPVVATGLSDILLDVRLDLRVLAFAAGVTLLTGLLFGLAPALRAANPNLQQFLNEKGARGALGLSTRRWMNATVVAQVALTLVLLSAALVTIKGFYRLQRLPVGFRPDGTLNLQINLPENKYPDHGQRVNFVEELLEQVRGLPGVQSAGVSTNIPLTTNSWDSLYECEGRPRASESELLLTADRHVSRGYLETLGVRLRRGRLFTAEDTAESLPVVIVSDSLARICWPNDDPIGKRVRRVNPATETPWRTVVGLVEDVKEDRAAFRRDRAVWYIPYGQRDSSRALNLLVRAEGDPARLVPMLREQVWAIDRDQPVSEALVMRAHLAELISPERFSALVMIFFAAMGLVLAAVGIFGLLSYVTGQRTKEIGVRMALGAQPGHILRLVVGQGMMLALIGLATGALGALATMRVLANFVYGADPTDIGTLGGAAVVLAVAAGLACFLPAHRASQVDPMTALHYE